MSQFPLQLKVSGFHRLIACLSGLFLIVSASNVLWLVVPSGVNRLDNALHTVVEPTIPGAFLYTVLSITTLAVASQVTEPRGVRSRDRFDLLYLGAVLGVLFFGSFYLLINRTIIPSVPSDLITTLLIGPVGMGAIALVYARFQPFNVPVGLPSTDTLPYIAGLTVLAGALGSGWMAVFLSIDSLLIQVWSTDDLFAPQLSLGDMGALKLLWSLVLPGVLAGIGWGILFNGAIQESLRTIAGPEAAIGAVVTLVSLVLFTRAYLFPSGPLVFTASVFGSVLLSLSLGFVAIGGAEFAENKREGGLTPVLGAVVGVLVALLFMLATIFVLIRTLGFNSNYLLGSGLINLIAPFVVATASLGYERIRSVWVPASVFAAYFVCSDVNLVVHLFG